MSDCYDPIKTKVLNWLETLKVPGNGCRYRFSAFTDDTIFCTCFALFILDLFKEVEQFTFAYRQKWISYIESFQNEQHGYFEPKEYYHKDKERNRYQLTCFCLSALGILDAEPKFPLRFIEQWKTPDDVKRYLYERECHKGRAGSGNKAMFLVIFLTYEYERTKESHLLDKINAWFEFHDKTQNQSGFWGSDLKSHFFHGLQNGFHQLLVYFYWNRPITKLNRIVDVALKIQDRNGLFSPIYGGWPCYDYDAIHILVNAHNMLDDRRKEIAASLEKAFYAINENQNEDGGFCQSKRNPRGAMNLIEDLPFYMFGNNPCVWYQRLQKSISVTIRRKDPITTGWTKNGRMLDESNLWDTWFRCLSLAEIINTVVLKDGLGLKKSNFHKTIGLGFNGNLRLYRNCENHYCRSNNH